MLRERGLDSVGEQVGTGASASSRSRVIHARLLENNSSTRGSGSWWIRERSRNRRLVLSSVRHVHTTTRLDTINYRRSRWNGRARRRLREEKGGKTKRIVTIYRYRTIKGNRTRERYLSRRESARKHLGARPVSWIHASSLESVVVLFATSDPCTSSVWRYPRRSMRKAIETLYYLEPCAFSDFHREISVSKR